MVEEDWTSIKFLLYHLLLLKNCIIPPRLNFLICKRRTTIEPNKEAWWKDEIVYERARAGARSIVSPQSMMVSMVMRKIKMAGGGTRKRGRERGRVRGGGGLQSCVDWRRFCIPMCLAHAWYKQASQHLLVLFPLLPPCTGYDSSSLRLRSPEQRRNKFVKGFVNLRKFWDRGKSATYCTAKAFPSSSKGHF